jgi:hypothetical protein
MEAGMSRSLLCCVMILGLLVLPLHAEPGDEFTLPYMLNGGDGSQYFIQRGGWFGQQGNVPVFSQAAMLMTNGQPFPQNQQNVRMDGDDVVIDGIPVPGGGATLTRRIHLDAEAGYIRYADVFSSNANRETTLNFQIQTAMNYGITAGTEVTEKKSVLGWVGQTGANNAAVVALGGPGAKVSPVVRFQQGNSFVSGSFRLTLPPGGSATLVHLYSVQPNAEAGEAFVRGLKSSAILKSLPPEVRRTVVNFPLGSLGMGDLDVLRGDAVSDVIELRSGDQLRGTLTAAGYRILTGFGEIDVPAAKVIGIQSAGNFRPRQLLITRDGEIIGGQIQTAGVEITLSTGQTTTVPLAQISRVGARKPADEPDELAPAKVLLVLQSGDRLAVDMPAMPIEMLTRYGKVVVPPDQLLQLELGSEAGFHRITLTDASQISGLMTADQISVRLASSGREFSLPVGAVARLQVTGDVTQKEGEHGTLKIVGGDVLIGTLTGNLRLDATFDTLTLAGEQLTALRPLRENSFDMQARLWDATAVSGQLNDPTVTMRLTTGLTLSVPATLIESYEHPAPQPSDQMTRQVNEVIARLAADDFATREAAEKQLVAMGRSILALLREARPSQSLEAQQRIDTVIRHLEKK